MREVLKGLDLDSETINIIMAEHGKIISKDKEELQTLKAEVNELRETSKDAEYFKDLYLDLSDKLEREEAEKKAKREDEILSKNINDAIGDRKFINDFTKNAIMGELKNALKDDANMGKSAKDLFEQITEGKDDIFANPNPIVDMPAIDENVETTVSKDDFDKMGYKDRVELKETNPELFNKYNNM